MKNDQFAFLDLFGNIEETYIEESSLPWTEGKAHVYRFGKRAACIAAIAALALGGIFHSQVEAAVKQLTSHIGELLHLKENVMPYTEVIGTAQTQNGITVTLNEVILGKNQLFASVTWKGDAENEEGSLSNDSILKINGTDVDCLSTGIWGGEPDSAGNSDVFSWDYPNGDYSGTVEMELSFTYYQHFGDDTGTTFTFAFSASPEELQRNTKTINVNREIDLGSQVNLKVENLSLNRVTSQVMVSCDNLDTDSYLYFFTGTDSKGNSFRYGLDYMDAPNYQFTADYMSLSGCLPDTGSEWMKLQLCRVKLPKEDEEFLEKDETGEEFWAADSGVMAIDEQTMESVGDEIRIDLN